MRVLRPAEDDTYYIANPSYAVLCVGSQIHFSPSPETVKIKTSAALKATEQFDLNQA